MFRIKHLRKTYPGGKLTLEQLAERSGVDRSSISRYENGKQWPSDEALAGIAAALNVTVAELFADYVPIPEDVLALARELEGTTPDELKAIVSMTRRFRQP